ncbi:MAG: DnaJ domain-containing protein [Crocinitomicaceae bacterium]
MKSKSKLSGFSVFGIGFLVGLFLSRNIGGGLTLGFVALMIFANFYGSKRNKINDKLDFTHEILALLSVILTHDKKILKSELNYVKRFLNHNFSEDEARAYLLKFREYTEKDLAVDKICVKLNQALGNAGKRQILHLIIGAAVADRELTEGELIAVYKIGDGLRLGKITVESLLSMHSFHYSGPQQNGRQQYQRQSNQQQYRRRSSPSSNLSQAYKILEITPQATEKEIKKAYRKLVVIYHPDKVANMGESYQKSAKEKFQKIQSAYEQIKAARGIK